jgi:hypothetical protein
VSRQLERSVGKGAARMSRSNLGRARLYPPSAARLAEHERPNGG